MTHDRQQNETTDATPSRPTTLAIRLRRGAASTLDVLAIVLLVLALRILLIDGFLVRVGDLRLSFLVWWRPMLWVGGIMVVRHLIWRQDPWPPVVWRQVSRLWRDDAFRAAWPPFLVSRFLTLGIGAMAVLVVGFATQPAWKVSDNVFMDLPARWDSGWYLGILDHGYSSSGSPHLASPIAFFPGFPLLAQAVGFLTGLAGPGAMFAVVCVCFLLGLAYLYRIARMYVDADRARLTLTLVAFYPFAVYYSALYTESVFLLTATGAFYHAIRRQPFPTAVFALIAGLTRPNGILLAAPLALIVGTQIMQDARESGGSLVTWWRASIRALPRLAAGAAPACGTVAYSAYIYSLTGDPFAWTKAQQAWHRSFGSLANIVADRINVVADQGVYAYVTGYPVEVLEFTAGFAVLGASVLITRRLGLAFGAFVALCVIPPLISGGSESVGRYTSPLFPFFIWLAAVMPLRHAPYWIGGFAMLEGMVAAFFFTWRPPF